MKKLLIALCALSIVACKEEPKVDYALFSGTITNPNSEVIKVTGEGFSKKIAVSKDGTFADTLKVAKGYYRFNDGKEGSTFYLSPGYNLNLTIDTKEFDETITYNGEGSANNNYLASKALNNEKLAEDFGADKLYILDESSFVSKIDELNNLKESLLNKATGLSSEFKALEKQNLKYDHLSKFQNYPSYHEYFAKKEDVKVSDDFMKPIKDLDFTNEEDYKSIAAYKGMVQNHYSSKLDDAEDLNKVFSDLSKLEAQTIKNDLAKNIAYRISPTNEENQAYFDGVLSLTDDNEFKEKLTKKYNKVKLLAKGMPSPKFVDYENHKGGKTSLEDLKGKYVYVDVWATWCGPCKREIPSLKKVEKAYHGQNIAFVSTSIDRAKDHDTWIKMVNDEELTGLQLFADNDWKSKFVTDYAIEGIPRFLLIDPAGNIVSADAPRPSDNKLIELLEGLDI